MDNNQENPEQENPTGDLNGQQALNVLIQAVRIAQGKGAYTIEDAEIISKAIKIFVPPTPAGEEGTDTDPIVNENDPIVDEGIPAKPVMMKVKK
jgi:hypothetical protein